MAAGDGKSPGAGDDESTAPRKPDLRVGSHDDMGVNISRDLRGTGGNARGHGATFSKMSFSSRGAPREEVVEEAPAPAKPPSSAPVSAQAPAAPPAAPAEPEKGTVVSWLTGLFTRR
ncbi:MAG: hypothetical protein H0U66_12265 [Gemmatimonadaceae bacterium]|nr:hypothetical protein [Gemmatimonadaceae bacterium]